MGCCGNSTQEGAGRKLEKGKKFQKVTPLEMYTKYELTGEMDTACEMIQEEIDSTPPESLLINADTLEAKRSEFETKAIYDNNHIKDLNKPFADQVEKSVIEVEGEGEDPIQVIVNKSKNRGENCAAFVYAHTGGGVLMKASQHNELMVRWAHKYNCIVFNVDYRLGPEAKAPGGQKDFMKALIHIHQNAEDLGIDKSKIVIGGDAGGGWICMGAYHLLLKEKEFFMPKMMILRHTMCANVMADEPYGNLANYEKFDQDTQHGIFSLLATDMEAQKDDPQLYPGKMPLDSLKMMPPTIVTTGEFDFLRRDALFLIERLKQAERLLDVLDMPQTFHGYEAEVESDHALKAEKETIAIWNKFVLGQ